jgi:hypothetical protein
MICSEAFKKRARRIYAMIQANVSVLEELRSLKQELQDSL